MGKHKNLQFVWPKDGPKGKGHRGFFGRLNNIVTNRGPDIFIQKKGSREPITPDFWGNWDSYHDEHCHDMEELGSYGIGPFTAARGTQRYDPYTRRYVQWSRDQDWDSLGVDGGGIGPHGVGYPHFTREERRRLYRNRARGHSIHPEDMRDWNHMGPKRFGIEYDWFWQNAHRRGENRQEGFHPLADINKNMRMHLDREEDLNDWLAWEGIT